MVNKHKLHCFSKMCPTIVSTPRGLIDHRVGGRAILFLLVWLLGQDLGQRGPVGWSLRPEVERDGLVPAI